MVLNTFWWTVTIPAGLLLDDTVSAPARQLYMALLSRTEPGRKGRTGQSPRSHTSQLPITCRLSLNDLADASGMKAPKSLRRYTDELVSRGWLAIAKAPGCKPTVYTPLYPDGGATVRVPAYLIGHSALPPAVKCLYAVLLARANGKTGLTVRHSELAQALRIRSQVTIVSLTRILARAGWLHVIPGGRHPNRYELLDPHLAAREDMLQHVQTRMRHERYKGEAIMKELLSVLIDDDKFQDNARPGFLVNPLTGQRMEFDRWYTEAGVAFEFNGPQHEQPTAVSPDLDDVRAQQARDLMKAAIAAQHGISLITIHPADLGFDRLAKLIGDRLPQRPLRWFDPVVHFLNRESRGYARQWA